MALYDAFFGSDQSLYTAYAIMAAIIAICITILLTSTDISIGNRILIVLFVIITLVPSIFLTLFEITCMVTGGTEPNRWWCYAFAWILAAFVIIYCVFVVIISLISLFTYNNVIDNVNEIEKKNKLSETATNNIAKEIINSDEEKKKMENFYLMPDENEQFRDLRKERPIARTIPQLNPLSLVRPQDLSGGCIPDIDPKCSHNNDILNDTKCCYRWFGRKEGPVKKIELFESEPMDELTPSIEQEDENEQFRDLRKERPIARTIMPQRDPLSLVKPQDLAGGCLLNNHPACSNENDILNDVKCCYKWFGSHKKPVKKIEFFEAEPMDELTPSIEQEDENQPTETFLTKSYDANYDKKSQRFMPHLKLTDTNKPIDTKKLLPGKPPLNCIEPKWYAECRNDNVKRNNVNCCNNWIGYQGFENRENFGAEPMDELTPPPVPIPPQDENKGNSNIQSNNESFTNNEGFETYYNNNKKYFSNFSPSGISNTLHDIKNAIPFPTFAAF
jgi:hypothetical protein